jgi:lysozyme family protein
MADFYKWYALMQKWEGGYANDPDDTGGETYAGVARNFNPNWEGWKYIDEEKAKAGGTLKKNWKSKRPQLLMAVQKIARFNYWNRVLADQIQSQSIANLLADIIWGGDAKAWTIRKFQEYLGVRPDGQIGILTVQAINSRDARTSFEALKKFRAAYYTDIASKKGNNQKWLRGWLNRLNDYTFVD